MDLEHIICVILIALLVVTFVASIVQLLMVFCSENRANGWSLTKAVNLLLPWGLLSRCIDMIINYGGDYLYRDMIQQTPLSMVLVSVPSYLFFSTFLILSLFWILLYYRSYGEDTMFVRKFHLVYLCINLCIYGVAGVLAVMSFIYPAALVIRWIESAWGSIVSLSVSLAFWVYGARVYASLSRLSIVSDDRLRYSRKIGGLTILCTAVFAFRGLFIFLFIFVIHTPKATLILRVVFLVLLELIPVVIILVVMGQKSKHKFDDYTSLLTTINRVRHVQSKPSSPLLSR